MFLLDRILLDLDRNGDRLPFRCLVLSVSGRHYLDLDLISTLLGLFLNCYVAIKLVHREVLVAGYLGGKNSR